MARYPTLRRGESGEWVAYFKDQLRAALSLPWSAAVSDGDGFDEVTESAVTMFQMSHGLDTDGVVGKRTWSALCGEDVDAEHDTQDDKRQPIVMSWVQLLGEGMFRFTFEGNDPTQEQAEWFLWPDGLPGGVDVTRSGVLTYDVTGLTHTAMTQMRDEVAARVQTTAMFVDTNTKDEAAADYQRRVQENEEALNTMNPDVGMTWREIGELGAGWHEVNNNFIWQGFEGTEHSVQTHPYFDDDRLNEDMRFFLNQDQSVQTALLSIEENWRDVSRMLVMRLMAGAF